MNKCKKLMIVTSTDDIHACETALDALHKEGLSCVINRPELYGVQASVRLVADAMLQHDIVSVVTMSSCVINFAGELVWQKILPCEAVMIELHYRGTAKFYRFDSEGILGKDWPYGCFEPDSDLAIDQLKGHNV